MAGAADLKRKPMPVSDLVGVVGRGCMHRGAGENRYCEEPRPGDHRRRLTKMQNSPPYQADAPISQAFGRVNVIDAQRPGGNAVERDALRAGAPTSSACDSAPLARRSGLNASPDLFATRPGRSGSV
jgi:hypothetical protein